MAPRTTNNAAGDKAMNIKNTFWKLVDSEGKHIQTYNHPIKAEHAADCYFIATGVMPKIIVTKKA